MFQDRIARAGLREVDLERTKGLGAELCEIDTRFGELSPRALFHSLDEAGALTHRIPDRGPLQEAMQEPPAGGRAEARGRAIRELHPERSRYHCRWDQIFDTQEPRYLDLGDPFAATAEWREQWRAPSLPPRSESQAQIDRGLDAYNAHDTDRSAVMFGEAIQIAERAADWEQANIARFWRASAHHDAGDLDAAETALAPALAADDVSSATRIRVWTRHSVIQIERPAPLAEIECALAGALERWQLEASGTGRSRITLNQARLLGARGKTAEAIDKAELALAECGGDPISFSVGSHLRWLVTYLLRAGRFRRALVHLDDWRGRIGYGSDGSHLSVSLTLAESNLSLRLGRHQEALDRASKALEQSASFRRHRTRLAACIAYLEAAAASRTLDATRRILAEVRGWRDVQIGEMRFELLRAEALVHLARARVAAAAGGGSKKSGNTAWQRFGEAYRAAQKEAERLDAWLDCRRHLHELEERIREL